jgi:hypothetical protein
MNNLRDKYFHCYNLAQAKFFKQQGIKEVDFDYSPVNKKVYFIFERNDELERVFKLWLKKCEDYNKN